MSWYTVGEIIVWLLIAAVLGGVLGWLLRGILRPRIVEVDRRVPKQPVAESELPPDAMSAREPQSERVSEAQPVVRPEPEVATRFAPPPEPSPDPRPASAPVPKSRGTVVTDVDLPQPKRTPSSTAMPTSRTPKKETPRTPPTERADARTRIAAIAKRTAGRGAAPQDDLVLVHGIGPKIAQLLADMDITSFQQIARLSDDDIEDITAALEAFPGRIARDDWKGSARKLHRETYGDDPLK